MNEQVKQPIRFDIVIKRAVNWTVKNHWVWLVVVIGVQYATGEMLAGEWPPIMFSLSTIRLIHGLNGKLILVMTVLLALEKGVLYLMRKGKI